MHECTKNAAESPDSSQSQQVLDAARKAALTKRQQHILDTVLQRGFVSLEELGKLFKRSTQTMRRDIKFLSQQGLLRRYHGGAAPPTVAHNTAYGIRRVLCGTEKNAIAKSLAAQIPDSSSLFLDIGTTSESVAAALEDHHSLRVITNNLNVAAQLCHHDDFDVIVAGGVVRGRDHGVTGGATVDFLNQFRADYGIVTLSGIDEDGTLLDFDLQEVRIARTIMSNSRQVMLAADHTKIGRGAMMRLGHLCEVHDFFTDRLPPRHLLKILEQASVRLHVAPETSCAS